MNWRMFSVKLRSALMLTWRDYRYAGAAYSWERNRWVWRGLVNR